MRGLTVIVTTADPERFRAALTLASAQAALGARARVYLHEAAVGLLAAPEPLRATARECGVALIACQTGAATSATDLSAHPDVAAGGLVSLLAELGDDRLVTV